METEADENDPLAIKVEVKESFRYLCPLCPKGFDLKDDLSGHFRVHREPSVAECRGCHTTFETTEDEVTAYDLLDQHLKSCQTYRSIWFKPKLKKVRKKSCPGERRRKSSGESESSTCQICRKSFKTVWRFESHMKSHENGQLDRVSCDRCGKEFDSNEKFTSSYRLKCHQIYCVGGRKRQNKTCDKCSKTFSSAAYYKTHIKNCSPTCENCGQTFKTQTGISCHLCPKSPFLMS